MQILIVEDEILLAMVLEDLMVDAGHTVCDFAPTAERALQLAEAARPDLALVDINLQDGRGSGVGLARELRQRLGIPSIFVTGQTSEALRNRDAALGYVNKPYKPETILACIEAADILKQGGKVPPDLIPRGGLVCLNRDLTGDKWRPAEFKLPRGAAAC